MIGDTVGDIGDDDGNALTLTGITYVGNGDDVDNVSKLLMVSPLVRKQEWQVVRGNAEAGTVRYLDFPIK